MPTKSTDQVVFCGTTLHFSNASKEAERRNGGCPGKCGGSGSGFRSLCVCVCFVRSMADFCQMAGARAFISLVNERNLQFERVRFACSLPGPQKGCGLPFAIEYLFALAPGLRVGGCGATKKLLRIRCVVSRKRKQEHRTNCESNHIKKERRSTFT